MAAVGFGVIGAGSMGKAHAIALSQVSTPLGRTAREAAAMARAAQASGRVAMTGFNNVKNPATQLARQIVAGGEIGEVIHFAVHAAAVADAVLASCDAGAWVRVDRIEAEARA